MGMREKIDGALSEMEALEGGAIANVDEKRMVGHYWLRDAALAPTGEIRSEIEGTLAKIKAFAGKVYRGDVKGEAGAFEQVLCIGIGGSALGPQLITNALGGGSKMRMFFLDNTDPDGMDRVFAEIEGKLGQTLVIVISKSGGTPEPRNGMLEAKNLFERQGLTFAKHAVAVTGEGSGLDKTALKDGWLERFRMFDWVGGRMSVMAAVGLLPAALAGVDIDDLLKGAREMDQITRKKSAFENPALLLALSWFLAVKNGKKTMVVIPYKDRLMLFSRYLQQLVMESLGKEKDRAGNVINEGLTVYGNKGSTDQHSYVQQLREGPNDFFVTFFEVLTDRVLTDRVLRDREGPSIQVEGGITSGDYLEGFLLGTREALSEKGRESITITIKECSPFYVGLLIALYERAVGFYASFVGINAYHQPGVEAGKKAAGTALELQKAVVAYLKTARTPLTIDAIAVGLSKPERKEWIFKILEHLACNQRGIVRLLGNTIEDNRYQYLC